VQNDRWPEFAAHVEARLLVGREVYGERSFEKPPAELAGEVEEELLDVCGWSFILWTRVRAIRAALEEKAAL
jgi:hypothetical protein